MPNDSALRANTCLQYAVRACGRAWGGLDGVACLCVVLESEHHACVRTG